MKRPISVVICGQPFTVEWVADGSGFLHDEPAAQGRTRVARQRIVVRDVDQGPHQLRDTVLHEVLHAALKLTAQDERLKDDDEEPIVYALATALLAVLRENPELVGWLTETDI